MALFPGQDPEEQIILFVRRHWFVLVRQVVLFGGLALVPLAAQFGLNRVAPGLLADSQSLGGVFVRLLFDLFWLFLLLLTFAHWIDYYLDYWVVTDRRVVSIEQSGLFSRTVAQLNLSRVQDATAEVHGVLPTFLHYGNAFIQSAGEETRFVFEEVPNPNKVVALVMELHRKVSPASGTEKTEAPRP